MVAREATTRPGGGEGAETERRVRVPSKGKRGDEKRSGSGGLSFGSWAHRPLESEIASDRN